MENQQLREIKLMLAVIYKKLDRVDSATSGKSKAMSKSVKSYLEDLEREITHID